jgi:dTDP-4-dehydrorhamnose 3,5-epimerase
MIINTTPLDGLLVIEPKSFKDERGFFLETYQAKRYIEAGIVDVFVQDNQSRSMKDVLRGMHFQVKRPQAQIVTVMRGRIFDVGVDLRPVSPTFGKWFGVELHDAGPRQIYMAPGFAHGFCVLSDWADLHYKVSRNYDAHDEGGLNWNDLDVGVDWPIENPLVTTRDANYPKLKELKSIQLPHSQPFTSKNE